MAHLDVQLAHQLLVGRLPASEREQWLRHADECARCRALLENERAFAAVLGLGRSAEPPPPDGASDPWPDGVAALDPTGRRRRWRAIAMTGLSVLALGLAGLLAWQLVRMPKVPARMARELRISPDVQAAVVADLDALTTLQREPWLAGDLETARTLEQLIRDAPASRP